MTYGVPSLSVALNERATDLIINCVAKDPQRWTGAPKLVADAVLQEFTSNGARQTGVGLRVLAQVDADPQRAAAIVNRIHRAFKIEKRVTPGQAHIYVYTGAVLAIRAVYDATVRAASTLDVALPERLHRGRFISPNAFVSPPDIWDHVGRLHTVLSEQDVLCKSVVDHIGLDAQMVRAGMRARHAEVQAAYRAKRAAEAPAEVASASAA